MILLLSPTQILNWAFYLQASTGVRRQMTASIAFGQIPVVAMMIALFHRQNWYICLFHTH